MAYIAKLTRKSITADAASRMLAYADFQTVCDALMSDLLDLYQTIPELEGTATTRAQGQALELRRILDTVFSAAGVADRIGGAMTNGIRQGREVVIQAQERESDQA